MKNNLKTQFNEYANHTLRNHLAELNTHYENKPMASKALKKEAYEAHQKIYGKELDNKIKTLLSEDGQSGLKSELEKLKKDYLAKLIFS